MGEASEAQEKRRERRKLEENNLTFEIISSYDVDPDHKICRALTKDLSMKGMRISTDKFFPVNSSVKINLSFSETHKLVRLYGIIKWIRSLYENELFDLGFEFVDVTHESNLALIEHLYSHHLH